MVLLMYKQVQAGVVLLSETTLACFWGGEVFPCNNCMVPMVLFLVAYEGIEFAIFSLHAIGLWVEGDSMTVILWLLHYKSPIYSINCLP